MPTSNSVLLIAFHYPPCSASSGLQRTLSFSKHLSAHGWRPVVLTVNRGAHSRVDDEQLRDIPKDVVVARSLTLDAARHFSIGGRYWSKLALPDRWRSWWATAVPRGLSLIHQHKVRVVWSTYPIATAHLIGATLTRMSGVPWVADFRDPMVEHIPETGEDFPKDPALRATRLRVESKTVRRAARVVFCTEAARDIVARRYAMNDRLEVISNGFDEQAFAEAERLRGSPAAGSRRVLLHSGTVYPGPDRDPTALFSALRTLAAEGTLRRDSLEVRLRDPSHEKYFQELAEQHEIADVVSIAPPLPYKRALAEMFEVDGLLLLQGATSNPAIPAKLYEYLRAGRPILALVHPAGETAKTLRQVGVTSTAPLTDPVAIAQLLRRWLSEPAPMAHSTAPPPVVAQFSRARLTERLAAVFDSVVASSPRS